MKSTSSNIFTSSTTMYVLSAVVLVCIGYYIYMKTNRSRERFDQQKEATKPTKPTKAEVATVLPENAKEARKNSGADNHLYYDYFPNQFIQNTKTIQPYKTLEKNALKPKEEDAISICVQTCNDDKKCVAFVYDRSLNTAEFYDIPIRTDDIHDDIAVDPKTKNPYPIGFRETFIRNEKRNASYSR